MTAATVVLVAHTALDVDAARRLADYGELDDAGVARALEQVHMQRWGRSDLPAHLCRIESLAAVIDDGGVPCLIRASADNERTRLETLFAAWPATAVELVDWSGAGRALLAARALAHDIVLPAGFGVVSACALGERVAPAPADHPAPAAQVERECLRLMAGLKASANPAGPVRRALARYRLWLRWQYVTGCIDADERKAREARLAVITDEATS